MVKCRGHLFGASFPGISRCRCHRASVAVRCDFSDNLMRVNKWQTGQTLQTQLEEAVALQDFNRAAGLRDSLAALELSPMQQLELHHATQLKNGSYHEKLISLRTLGQLCPTDETLALIMGALHDERLAVAAEDAVQAIWLRHPTSVKVNQLMEDGMTELNTKGATPEAQKMFEEATDEDPTYAEAWNKLAVVLYLKNEVHESIAACERVLQLNPRHYLALSGKGMCHAKLGQQGCAADSWRAALQINPFLPQLRRFLAEIDNSS